MAARKTIVLFAVVLLTGCFLITFSVIANERQQTASQGQQIAEEPLSDDDYHPGFYYTVQKGDTLWALSKKFYNSEWQWPALWGQNADITNPHLIYPGQRIRLHERTNALRHPVSAKAEPEQPAEPQPTAVAEAPAPAEPAPTVYYLFPGISYVGFVQKLAEPEKINNKSINDPLAIGVLLKTEGEDKKMISQNDRIYIAPINTQTTGGAFIVGNLYSIYTPPSEVDDPLTHAYAGHQFKIVGAAEVTAVADEYVTAKVVKSLDTLSTGCFIMPFEKRNKEIPIIPAPPGLTGELLLAENHAEMSSEYSIVFLNKGEADGVKVGQRYDIYHQDKGEINGKETLLNQFVFGQCMVLLTRETTATAVVTTSTKPISQGDLFKSAK